MLPSLRALLRSRRPPSIVRLLLRAIGSGTCAVSFVSFGALRLTASWGRAKSEHVQNKPVRTFDARGARTWQQGKRALVTGAAGATGAAAAMGVAGPGSDAPINYSRSAG